MSNFYIKEIDNAQYIVCRNDLSVEAYTTKVFETALTFDFKPNEEIVIKDAMGTDTVYIACEILKEEDDAEKALNLTFINTTENDIVIPAETNLTKVLSYRKYKSAKEDCLRGYSQIYEGYNIKAFSKKDNVLKNVEMILNDDEKPVILNMNFIVEEMPTSEE